MSLIGKNDVIGCSVTRGGYELLATDAVNNHLPLRNGGATGLSADALIYKDPGDSVTVAVACDAEDARRMVACLNAFRGVPTSEIERIGRNAQPD